MNYRNMSISQGSKYAGFWWYMVIELILISVAFMSIIGGDVQTGMIVFVLIELREINLKLKDS